MDRKIEMYKMLAIASPVSGRGKIVKLSIPIITSINLLISAYLPVNTIADKKLKFLIWVSPNRVFTTISVINQCVTTGKKNVRSSFLNITDMNRAMELIRYTWSMKIDTGYNIYVSNPPYLIKTLNMYNVMVRRIVGVNIEINLIKMTDSLLNGSIISILTYSFTSHLVTDNE